MLQVWDRQRQALVQAPEVGAGAIRFVYGTAFGRLLAKGILCRRFVSGLYGAWQKSSLSQGKVQRFMEQYQIPTDGYTQTAFPNFNAFFTRQRRQAPDPVEPDQLPAVADSKLTVFPINANTVFSVKDVPYRLEELLENKSLAAQFAGGLCLIFRLSPEDYHRYAYPDDGTQEKTVHIPGVLHTVNPIAGSLGVYRRNARAYTLLHTRRFGTAIELEVGAMLVGKIRNHSETPGSFTKLQEKGYFEYGGSTVILLLQNGVAAIDEDILQYSAQGVESKVRLGEPIGRAL